MPNQILSVGMSEYRHHCDNQTGFCPSCGELQESGMFESDARKVECEDCGEMTAMGMGEVLEEGLLDLQPDPEEEDFEEDADE